MTPTIYLLLLAFCHIAFAPPPDGTMSARSIGFDRPIESIRGAPGNTGNGHDTSNEQQQIETALDRLTRSHGLLLSWSDVKNYQKQSIGASLIILAATVLVTCLIYPSLGALAAVQSNLRDTGFFAQFFPESYIAPPSIPGLINVKKATIATIPFVVFTFMMANFTFQNSSRLERVKWVGYVSIIYISIVMFLLFSLTSHISSAFADHADILARFQAANFDRGLVLTYIAYGVAFSPLELILMANLVYFCFWLEERMRENREPAAARARQSLPPWRQYGR